MSLAGSGRGSTWCHEDSEIIELILFPCAIYIIIYIYIYIYRYMHAHYRYLLYLTYNLECGGKYDMFNHMHIDGANLPHMTFLVCLFVVDF